ncbi:ribose-5-phosphate isomerase RpiA [Aquisalibacillus elongatus]|uniref:Ribose-5-phosphate isomerase A n=1 Tax=Aquisalibacillus elongatus TaxID=485577 RepID=A0A3N5C4C2_9BACI|nr:ribose-5-phosphate isomerase RpiA [Aquisalibacillus elongatus]RPF54302.1 ribose-5-phosphate isomerase [Aquisalibacillus elongatus]
MGNSSNKKRKVAQKAIEYVKDGMVLGLGSGSTMYWVLEELGQRVQSGLNIQGIPSSVKTQKLAKEFGIPLTDFSHVQELDLAIDGADEIDPEFRLIKGGGGSLLREKIVDVAANKFIVVADDTKLVNQLGSYPLPIEVVRFGWETTKDRVESLGCKALLREENGEPFVTNNHQYILDCHFNQIEKPHTLHNQLKSMVGVIETGLFLDMVDLVIVGREQEVTVLEKEELI